MIVGGVKRMESMIKGLLDYAAATAKEPDRTLTDSKAVLDRTLHNLRYVIDAENAVITFDELPIVQANEDRLAQVLSNLITNASSIAAIESLKSTSQRQTMERNGSSRSRTMASEST